MINSSCTEESTTVQWPMWWEYVRFLRFVFPIVLHICQISVVEVFTQTYISLEYDLLSVIFVVGISGTFIALFPCINPEQYQTNNRYIASLFEILLQIVAVDLGLRFVVVPFCYILHYLCIKGYVANFVNKCLFVLYAVDGKVPVSKFVRISKTEEGFELTRRLISYFIIFIGLLLCNVHRIIISIVVKIINFMLYIVVPLFKEVVYKKKRPRKRN